MFFNIFMKENNFYDFLLASLKMESTENDLLPRSKVFPERADTHSEGKQK